VKIISFKIINIDIYNPYLVEDTVVNRALPFLHAGSLEFMLTARTAVVHLNFRARSTFPAAVCTVPSSMDRTSRCNKVDAVRLYAFYRFNLLLLKEQRCVTVPLCKQ